MSVLVRTGVMSVLAEEGDNVPTADLLEICHIVTQFLAMTQTLRILQYPWIIPCVQFSWNPGQLNC